MLRFFGSDVCDVVVIAWSHTHTHTHTRMANGHVACTIVPMFHVAYMHVCRARWICARDCLCVCVCAKWIDESLLLTSSSHQWTLPLSSQQSTFLLLFRIWLKRRHRFVLRRSVSSCQTHSAQYNIHCLAPIPFYTILSSHAEALLLWLYVYI